MTPEKALEIATIAHGAIGQTRASGAPYIVHPMRVAQLTRWFCRQYNREIAIAHWMERDPKTFKPLWEDDLVVAAYLHDVIEDTKLELHDLHDLGISSLPNLGTVEQIQRQRIQLDIVWRLTKAIPDKPADPSYYQAISECTGALVVKCADNCANLEDAYDDLFIPVENRTVRRWANYVKSSQDDVLPMYKLFPGLSSELQWRIDRINKAIPLAKAQRAIYVQRKLAESYALEAAIEKNSWKRTAA